MHFYRIGKINLPLSARLAESAGINSGKLKVDTGPSDVLAIEIKKLMRQHKTLVGHLLELYAKLGERERDTPAWVKNEEILKRLEQETQKIEQYILDKRRMQLAIFRELKRRELKRKACFNWPKAKQHAYCKTIPNYITLPLKPGRFVALSGPDLLESEKVYQDIVGARTVSTYPMLQGLPGTPSIRQGDPICDRFLVHLLENRTVISVADGCNWGKLPSEAAGNASSSFMRYMRNVHDKLVTTRKTARYLIRAFAEAHDSIVFGKKELFDAGTTTLIGGLILELDAEIFSDDEGEPVVMPVSPLVRRERPTSSLRICQDSGRRWAFVCASIGDCKAFHWSAKKQTVRDVTSGNRTNPLNASDCGGRLGPHLEGGLPDLRNFGVFLQVCEEGDIIMVMSDGVHDNLDPQHFGKTPKDLGLTDSDEVSWHDLPYDKVDEVKEKWREQLLREKIFESVRNPRPPLTEEGGREGSLGDSGVGGGSGRGVLGDDEMISPDPEQIMRTVISYCVDLTSSSREFMEKYPGKKLQDDYLTFPGKMDRKYLLFLSPQFFFFSPFTFPLPSCSPFPPKDTTFVAIQIRDLNKPLVDLAQDEDDLPSTPKGLPACVLNASFDGSELRPISSSGSIPNIPLLNFPDSIVPSSSSTSSGTTTPTMNSSSSSKDQGKSLRKALSMALKGRSEKEKEKEKEKDREKEKGERTK
jgi:hypothetical protein